ncbi:N-formylglutamate amidohydrolase [Parahaliea aestuarii]|uniref:N-formylglutamate amidohydrolase n=1 Tax=Parahaliea aestuarii TaxID=1852021 RepID=A0A5C8ZV57_9GAMM|nr:N-formylglutamate amidohydrolase [Parahaliea aestuarii]TXS91634.1 N-formylglutamate amidohydrolase [Parahaliea aestuarii]
MKQKDRLRKAETPLIITCEHGGNQVPARYRHLFSHCRSLLKSHRGFDPGALVMARALARHFSAPLLTSTVSRLVVDLNRSIGHRDLHMEAIRALPTDLRQEIVEHYYRPYRKEVERLVAESIALRGRAIHFSCHSFTERLDGSVRHADVSLLYDPARKNEKVLCAKWKSALTASAPDIEVRRNYPYQGRNDGLTSALRKKFSADTYLGIELELNQRHLLCPSRQWFALRQLVIATLNTALVDCHA